MQTMIFDGWLCEIVGTDGKGRPIVKRMKKMDAEIQEKHSNCQNTDKFKSLIDLMPLEKMNHTSLSAVASLCGIKIKEDSTRAEIISRIKDDAI